jgi:hypothetical protein
VSEHDVNLESDPETPGRAGREGEKTSGRTEDQLLPCDRRFRPRVQRDRYAVCRREVECYARPATLTRAVATVRGGPVMWMTRMFRVRLVVRSHAAGVSMTGCFSVAMHRTGYDGSCCATERRHPRREQDDNELGGKQSAHHAVNLQAKC